MKPVLSYAVAVAASAMYFRVAILLVSLLSSGLQLGYFSLSFNIMAALFAIPAMLVSVAFPIFSRAARDDHGRLAYAIERVFEVSLIVGAWMSLAIALGAHFAIEIIGGHKFAPAADVLAIQGISVGATFVGTVWGFGLLSLGRHRAILLFNLAALAAVVVAVSILASVDGARGAAIGTSAVELALAAVGARLLVARPAPPAPLSASPPEGGRRSRDRRDACADPDQRARASRALVCPIPDRACDPASAAVRAACATSRLSAPPRALMGSQTDRQTPPARRGSVPRRSLGLSPAAAPTRRWASSTIAIRNRFDSSRCTSPSAPLAPR